MKKILYLILFSLIGMFIYMFSLINVNDSSQSQKKHNLIIEINKNKQLQIIKYFKSEKEPNVRDAVWRNKNVLALAVNNGYDEKGYAEYVCVTLYNNFHVNKIWIELINWYEMLKAKQLKVKTRYFCNLHK
jgi:hypothetical protein